ncbi:cytochrome P450 [Serendipita vermifera]|nr:cytochrome P450 [Serendipita vermifera]
MENHVIDSINSVFSEAKRADIILGLTATIVLGSLMKWALTNNKSHGGKEIPGPRGLPFLGNALDIPRKEEWIVADKWRRQYGPILKLDVTGMQLVLLSDPKYLNELFVQRACSGRPQMTMSGDLCGFNDALVFYDDGPKLRQGRKYFKQTIGGKKKVVTVYGDTLAEHCTKLLLRIMDNASQGGEALVGEIRQYVAATTLSASSAIHVKDAKDPYVVDAERAMNIFNTTTNVGAYLVDAFPILKHVPSWFPGAGFKRQAKIWKADLHKTGDRLYDNVMNDVVSITPIKSNNIKNSFLHEHLSQPNLSEKDADLIKWSAITMYLGGSDTSAALSRIFVLAMIMNPDAQRKGREEIHGLLGSSRLPNFDDREKLPYIDAILKESMRWHPVIPLGASRLLSQDEILDGYVLKKGTTVIGNIWGILHNETYFSNPEEFIPERHLPNSKETANLDVSDVFWGWGRRICPGKDFADAEVWLFIAQSLATLEFLPPLDANGNEIALKKEFSSGNISHPVPYDCRIRPQNERTEALILISSRFKQVIIMEYLKLIFSETKGADLVVGLAATMVFGSVMKWALMSNKSKSGKEIPGPPGLPILKNALDIPRKDEYMVFNQWQKQYGPIFKLELAGKCFVFLSDPKYLNELFVQRAATCSGRPVPIMAGELCGYNAALLFFPDGPKLRQSRKYFKQTIGGKKKVATVHGDTLTEQCTKLILRIMNNSNRGGGALHGEVRYYIAAATLAVSSAIDVKDAKDPYVVDAERVLNVLSLATTPGAFLVDIFPKLKYLPSWLPGAGFKRQAKIWKADLEKACNRPFEKVMKDLNSNIIKNSFLHDHLSQPNLSKEDADLIKWSGISMYLGGSDTAVALCRIYILAMIMNQDVQRKAREEIYNLLGSSRLPNFGDREKLPYVDAILKESMRWHPVIPLGGTRILSQDEILDGYVLKKNTRVIGNIWAILHDERYFSNPEDFIPERHLPNSKERADLDVNDVFWGWGRRLCPGMDFADAETWLFIAQSLATLEFLPPLDENGNEIQLKKEFISGTISHPVDYECRIVPQNERTAALIRESAAAYLS